MSLLRKSILSALLPVLAADLHAGTLTEIRDTIRNLPGYSRGFDKDAIRDSVIRALGQYLVLQDTYRGAVGCGCRLKGGGPEAPYAASSDIDPFRNPYIYFMGDSRVATLNSGVDIDQNFELSAPSWGGFAAYYQEYTPRINGSLAIGGTTSQNLRTHFDECAGGDFRRFYPDPNVVSHIQLEYKRGVLLTGGNDFKIYEPILRALPILIPLRHNHVLNNMNRVVSYFQAQNAEVLILGQTPFPVRGYLNTQGRMPTPLLDALGNWQARMDDRLRKWQAYESGDESTADRLESCVLLSIPEGGCNFHGSMRDYTGIGIYARGFTVAARGFLANQIQQWGGLGGPDNTWLSMQMAILTTVTVPFVIQTRNVGFVNDWHLWVDPYAVAHTGQWHVGNPVLYNDDGIHYSAYGHALLANSLMTYWDTHGWDQNEMPAAGDRCHFVTGLTHPTGQPSRWTEEPPPLPAASDELLILIGICLSTGNCKV
ncbi:MAG: hypothetical protein H7A21_10705 [Spirochaetales bacterium]|nr:hypothetical protein [Leptospiraceae bacterium]MCP5481893.1 hypothetical protein [Spirochaetales bacterium]MCP5486301.1 hypothetical protein [Spirochaetales bacterium]